jgi:hypothetical protein
MRCRGGRWSPRHRVAVEPGPWLDPGEVVNVSREELGRPAAAVRVIAPGNWSLARLSAWWEDPAHTGPAEGPPDVSDQRREAPVADGGERNLWAAGAILFAGIMLIVVGLWEALEGLIAIVEDEFYVATRRYLFQFDVTAWGWIHVVLGLVVAVAGYGLLAGRTWARVVAITLAALSAIANFLWLPYYPVWALLIIAVDVLVIWAVAVHGREVSIL